MNPNELPSQLVENLRNPSVSLTQFGRVMDQRTGSEAIFDPKALTHDLQATIMSYFSKPPQTDTGQTCWLALLGPRQTGKSTAGELCAYPVTAYSPGWDHVCIADTKDRAEYLHRRVHYTHARWPEGVRAPTVPNREIRQLTFDERVGGKMRILSGESGAVGIGQSPDSFHGSELPYWADAGAQFTLIYPSMVNRDHSLMFLESTPAPADAPSAEWWHDHCREAKRGGGRWLYSFFPFWDGKLNRRPWHKTWKLDIEELRLLDKYGSEGLTKENLSFRRLMLETDSAIRRNPDLFQVYYPFDDITCWISTSSSVIHGSLLDRHKKSILNPWVGPYQEYEKPEPGAFYVIGVDPAGYAARDHAAFQVLKVYDGEWTQVACFADHTEPIPFSKKILEIARRYNDAVVAVESNGVGAAVLALLEELDCKKIYHEKAYRPGITATSKSVDQMLSWLQEALKDELILNDSDTLDQLISYKHDKRVEKTASSEILYGRKSDRRRRDRHHWDKISALQMAIVAARKAPRRYKKVEPKGLENVILFKDLTWNQIQSYRKKVNTDKGRKKKSRVTYRSVRKRR